MASPAVTGKELAVPNKKVVGASVKDSHHVFKHADSCMTVVQVHDGEA